MLGIATLWHIWLCEPSMLLLGCEVAILLSPPAFLLLALWIWLYLQFLGFYGSGWGMILLSLLVA